MTAKACIYLQDPSSSRTVDVGSYVTVRMGMKNCGDAVAYFYAGIEKNGQECVSKYNQWLNPGEVLKFFTSECDITSMPNSTITIKFYGGHAEGSVWHEDFVKYVTLTPKAAVCDQPVRVIDEVGVKIDNARVDCYEGSNFKAHCTTYYGDCLLSFLDSGTSYRAIASKTGYECLNCEKSFTACTSRIVLSLKKKPTTCNQSFIVKDTSGNTVTKNCIIVIREGSAHRGECATSTSGTCTATGLIKGTSLRACIEQVPSGYELTSNSCKNFTACTSRITLTLKKIPTDGTLRVTSTPVQGADIYINDIKQSYKTNHDFLLEAGYYNVKVKLTGYKEPAMQGVTVVAGQTKTLTFTLEEEAPSCSDYTDEESCITAGCHWYDGACHEFGPVECSDYTDAITCEDNLCHWWSDGTCHDTEEPEEFNLICWSLTNALTPNYEKESVEVRANIQIGASCLLGYRVDGIVPITIKNLTSGKEYTVNTNETGYMGYYFPFTDCVEGDNEFQLVSGDVSSVNKTVNLKLECDIGAIITVKDVPSEGLRVEGTPALTYIGALEKEVTPDNPTVTFDSRDSIVYRPKPGEKWKFRVLRDDDWVLDETITKITIPETGCQPVSLNGWNGCKWRILLTGPSEASLDKSFQIKAVLKQTPNITVGKDWNIDFYEESFETTPIWTGATDEDGVAICTVPAKVTEGTYTYFAKQSDAPTFCEPQTGLSIEVKESIPKEGIWEQILAWISDAIGVTREQAATIAYAGIGLVALIFLSSLFKR